jgi:hypothetical protein
VRRAVAARLCRRVLLVVMRRSCIAVASDRAGLPA